MSLYLGIQIPRERIRAVAENDDLPKKINHSTIFAQENEGGQLILLYQNEF